MARKLMRPKKQVTWCQKLEEMFEVTGDCYCRIFSQQLILLQVTMEQDLVFSVKLQLKKKLCFCSSCDMGHSDP